MTFDDIVDDFSFLDDWEDRYRHIIELGRDLEPIGAENHDDAHKVRGCASQVWLTTEVGEGADPKLIFKGDSDAHIVRGLIALLIALYSDKKASEVLGVDAKAELARLDLEAQLTPQRSNGLYSMVERIRRDAEGALNSA